MEKSEDETSNKDLLYDTKMLMYFLVFCIVIGKLKKKHNFLAKSQILLC